MQEPVLPSPSGRNQSPRASNPIDRVAVQARRSWENGLGSGAFVLATMVGSCASLGLFGFVVERDTAWILAGPALAWLALAALVWRGKRLQSRQAAAKITTLAALEEEQGTSSITLSAGRWQSSLELAVSLAFLIPALVWDIGPTLGRVFLGACALHFALQVALPPRLRLLPQGFEVKVWHRRLYRWERCRAFLVWKGPYEHVAFTYEGRVARGLFSGHRLARGLGANVALPNTFGLTGDELLQVLEEAQKNALADGMSGQLRTPN